jgi:hypothetical protein
MVGRNRGKVGLDPPYEDPRSPMPLQNRVLPTGELVALPVRGTLTGNRGILHDAEKRLGPTRWRHMHWISCSLSHKDWHREVMSPGTWTELFFLDEAVALAAGHRPCALCRRAAYRAFTAAWAKATGRPARAAGIDEMLHAARLVPGTRDQQRHGARCEDLPEGSFILVDDRPYLVRAGHLCPWSPQGYGNPIPRPGGHVTVLTPAPLVAALAAGYRAALHPSAGP